jgi:hypothetical protein
VACSAILTFVTISVEVALDTEAKELALHVYPREIVVHHGPAGAAATHSKVLVASALFTLVRDTVAVCVLASFGLNVAVVGNAVRVAVVTVQLAVVGQAVRVAIVALQLAIVRYSIRVAVVTLQLAVVGHAAAVAVPCLAAALLDRLTTLGVAVQLAIVRDAVAVAVLAAWDGRILAESVVITPVERTGIAVITQRARPRVARAAVHRLLCRDRPSSCGEGQ